MPFALAAGVTVPIAAFTTVAMSTGRRSSWSLPVMIRDTSSSSSMICVLRGGVPDDGVHGAGRLVGRELAAVEQVGPADDGGQRRPQLVGQGRQELVLQAVRGLGRRARLLRQLAVASRLPEQQAHFQHVVDACQHLDLIERLADEILGAGL